MAYNKVTYGGQVIVDLTEDTVKASDLRSGVTAHDNTGKQITGTYVPQANIDLSKDTAGEGDILSGKTAHTASGAVTGTMPSNGAVSGTVGVGQKYTIPQGYHDGNGIVSGPTLSGNASTANVLYGSTFYSNSGTKQTGSMPNRGAVTGDITTATGYYTIPAGYHNGKGTVSIDSAEQQKIVAGNIKSGITILGVKGTLQTGSTTIGTDTSDATAVAGDIVSPKTAYVNGEKLTGTIPNKTSVTTVLSKTFGRDGTDKNYIKVEPGYYGINSNDGKNHYFYINDSDLKNLALIGTIPNKGSVSGTISEIGSSVSYPAGYYSSVSVGIDSDEEAKIIAGNIRSGVTILGVTGTLKTGSTTIGTDTSDATATAGDILTGKTAYVNGSKLTGTIANNGAVSANIGIGGSYTIPAGYHNGKGIVTNSVANKGAVSGAVGIGGTYSSTQNGYVTTVKVTGPTLSGTATEEHVLEDDTFYSNTGTKLTGTMVNNGAVSASVGIGGSYTIPEGYHDGTGTVTNSVANKGAITGSVAVGGTYSSTQNGYVSTIKVTGPTLSGTAVVSDVLYGETFYSNNGTKKTGSMTNNGAVSGSVGVGGSYAIPAGYHNGNGVVSGPTLSGNATAAQVLSGSTFYSNSGAKQTGTLVIQHFYTGTSAPSSSQGIDGDVYIQT